MVIYAGDMAFGADMPSQESAQELQRGVEVLLLGY